MAGDAVIEPIHPAWDALEQNAIIPEGRRATPFLTNSEIELSKAISLKRIADSIESIAAVWGKRPSDDMPF